MPFNLFMYQSLHRIQLLNRLRIDLIQAVLNDLLWAGHFDFIHGRGLLYQNLNLEGWLEMQEYEAWVTSDDDTIRRTPWTREQVDVASTRFGRRLNVAHMHKQWLEEAGFEDVREYVFKQCTVMLIIGWPLRQVLIGSWLRDKRLKEIGRYGRAQMLDAVEPFTLALYTCVLGHSLEQTQVLMEGVKRELSDAKLPLYNAHHFIYGRKPGNDKTCASHGSGLWKRRVRVEFLGIEWDL